jgi:hypothetical protein
MTSHDGTENEDEPITPFPYAMIMLLLRIQSEIKVNRGSSFDGCLHLELGDT